MSYTFNPITGCTTFPQLMSAINNQLQWLADQLENGTALGEGSVGNAALGDNAVNYQKLGYQAVEHEHIGEAQIETAHIANANITTAKIEDLAVTNAKIAAATIEGAKIANATIDTAQIKDLAVTGAKIGSATITDANIGSLNAGKITAGDIDATKISIKGTGGTVLFDSTGITGSAVPGGTITYAMLEDYIQNAIDFIAAGKAIYYQPLEPTGGSYAAGDVWFDTDAAYLAYEWSGTAWVARAVDSAAFNVTYMMASLLNAGILTADHINAVTIVGNKIYFGNQSGAHGELYATGGVTYFDMYDDTTPTPVKRSSWTFNGMDFIDGAGAITRIATTTADATITVGSGKDFETPQAAENSLPYIINHDIVIDMYTGDYSALIINGHSGKGNLYYRVHAGETVTIVSVEVHSCNCTLYFDDGITLTTTGGAALSGYQCPDIHVQQVTITAAAALKIGMLFDDCSGVVYDCTISNRQTGILARNQSLISLYSVAGTGNTTGIWCQESTVYDQGSNTITGTTPRSVAGGGIITDADGNQLRDFPRLRNRQDDTANSVVNNQLIQTGWGWKLGTAASYMTEAVTFPVEYDDIPVVIVSNPGTLAGTNPTDIGDLTGTSGDIVAYNSTTTTGFTVLMATRDNTNQPNTVRYGYAWMAIGTKARS